jgi:hypothetical protein
MTQSTMFALILATVLTSTGMRAHAEQGGQTAPATSREASEQRTSTMKISITAGDRVITANLVTTPLRGTLSPCCPSA